MFLRDLMLRLATKKLIQGVLMLIFVSFLTFALLSSAGGDSLSALRDNPQVSEETITSLAKVHGLDRPLAERYGIWLFSAIRGEFGESFSFKTPVWDIARDRFSNTAKISLTALAIAMFLSLGLAILLTRYPSRMLSVIVEALILLTASTPRIVIALLVLLASLRFSFALSGSVSFNPLQFILTAIVLALPLISIYLAQLRSGFGEIMNEDFIRLARAKGLSEWRIIIGHALRPILNPLLTLAGLSLGGLLGGSVIVETVLGWPGIGALMVAAVRGRDVPLIMCIVVISTFSVWVGNTLGEFLLLVNDKRLRRGAIE